MTAVSHAPMMTARCVQLQHAQNTNVRTTATCKQQRRAHISNGVSNIPATKRQMKARTALPAGAGMVPVDLSILVARMTAVTIWQMVI